MIALSIIKTSQACPTQYEGKLDDGRMFYFRYRGGVVSIRVSEHPTDDVMDAVDGEELFRTTHGDALDGWMSDDTAIQFLSDAGINIDAVLETFEE